MWRNSLEKKTKKESLNIILKQKPITLNILVLKTSMSEYKMLHLIFKECFSHWSVFFYETCHEVPQF